jgi:hypothetical protein
MGWLQAKTQRGAFFSLPRTGTTVTMVGRTASAETGLGGAVSFLGFFVILLLFCCPFAMMHLLR